MATRFKLAAALALFYIVMANLRCNKVCLESVSKYTFEIGIKAVPNKDTIEVGDTIWLILDAPVKLMDQGTDKMINYSAAMNLGSSIAFTQDTSSTGYIKAANKFNYSLKKGSETKNADPGLYREYLFEEKDNRYLFTLGIIPKEAGVYGIVLSNAANVYRKKDKCTKAFFQINFQNTDQHYNLNPNYHGGPVPPGGDYYFVVK